MGSSVAWRGGYLGWAEGDEAGWWWGQEEAGSGRAW